MGVASPSFLCARQFGVMHSGMKEGATITNGRSSGNNVMPLNGVPRNVLSAIMNSVMVTLHPHISNLIVGLSVGMPTPRQKVVGIQIAVSDGPMGVEFEAYEDRDGANMVVRRNNVTYILY